MKDKKKLIIGIAVLAVVLIAGVLAFMNTGVRGEIRAIESSDSFKAIEEEYGIKMDVEEGDRDFDWFIRSDDFANLSEDDMMAVFFALDGVDYEYQGTVDVLEVDESYGCAVISDGKYTANLGVSWDKYSILYKDGKEIYSVDNPDYKPENDSYKPSYDDSDDDYDEDDYDSDTSSSSDSGKCTMCGGPLTCTVCGDEGLYCYYSSFGYGDEHYCGTHWTDISEDMIYDEYNDIYYDVDGIYDDYGLYEY